MSALFRTCKVNQINTGHGGAGTSTHRGKNRIPHNWGNDGSVWAKLSERDEDSVFAALYEVIITVHDKMDMKLFS